MGSFSCSGSKQVLNHICAKIIAGSAYASLSVCLTKTGLFSELRLRVVFEKQAFNLDDHFFPSKRNLLALKRIDKHPFNQRSWVSTVFD